MLRLDKKQLIGKLAVFSPAVLYGSAVFILVSLSLNRGSYFLEHLENFSWFQLNQLAAACLTFLIAYWLVLFIKSDINRSRQFWLLLIMLATVLVLLPPVLSRDPGAYLIESRNFLVFHANPYLVPENGVAANSWIKELGQIWWLSQTSVYGPLFALLTAPFAVLGFGSLILSIIAYKIALAALFVGSVLIVQKIVRLNNLNKNITVWYALNPAIWVSVLLEGHNDMIVLFFLLLALYIYQKQSETKGAFWLALAVATKYSSVILLPLFWMGRNNGTVGHPESAGWRTKDLGRRGDRMRLASGFFARAQNDKLARRDGLITSVVVSLCLIVIVFLLASAFFDFPFHSMTQTVIRQSRQGCFYSCTPAVALVELVGGKYEGAIRLILFMFLYLVAVYRFLFQKTQPGKFIFWVLCLFFLGFVRWLTPWYLVQLIPFGLLLSDDRRYLKITYAITAYSLLHYVGI